MLTVKIDYQVAGRRQLINVAVNRVRGGNVLKAKVELNRVDVAGRSFVLDATQSRKFRCKCEVAICYTVIQRLDPKMIAGEQQLTPPKISQSKTKHAAKLPHAIR